MVDYKKGSNKVLFKKILEDCFFEFFTHIPEIIGIVRERFIFQIIGLFLLFMFNPLNHETKTCWWVQQQDETAIILMTKFSGKLKQYENC